MRDDILVVSEERAHEGDAIDHPRLRLGFRFEAGLQRIEASPAAQSHASYKVPAKWRAIDADFRQQVLNLPFTELLIRTRPAAIRVETLVGCTLDLPRIALLLEVPVTVVLPPVETLPAKPGRAASWLSDVLASATALELPEGQTDTTAYEGFTTRELHAFGQAPLTTRSAEVSGRFDYALFEIAMRDHALLWQMQTPYVRFFEACDRVLDVGCGAGVFLGLLEASGIAACGVERDPGIVRYARGLGFDVTEGDALEFLEQHRNAYDGLYCSHFVEHLPIAQVERLLALLGQALLPGGRVVLVFPDPESIRSQLLGFWRDPEHVRFYHPDLIELIGRAQGMDCVWHSHRDGPHREVVAFPAMPGSARLPDQRPLGPWQASGNRTPPARRGPRWLRRLGFGRASRLEDLEHQQTRILQQLERLNAAQMEAQQRLAALQMDTLRLWQVNQTWAWEDNAVLVFEKPALARSPIGRSRGKRTGDHQ